MRFHSIALLGCLIAASLAVPLPENDNTSNAKSIKDTCTDLNLAEDGYTLTASCQSLAGESKESSIDLDKFIGNENGQFRWAGTDFSQSIFHDSDGNYNILIDATTLEGSLENKDGQPWYSTLDLAENIKNDDGTLKYTGPPPPPPQ